MPPTISATRHATQPRVVYSVAQETAMPHTPGPWTVDETTKLPGTIVRQAETRRLIAEVRCAHLAKGRKAVDAARVANARLIAAAPALLKERNALREALSDLLAVAPRCPDLREQDCNYCASRIVARALLRAVEG